MKLSAQEKKDLEETQLMLTMVEMQNNALDDEAELSLQFTHGAVYREEEFQYEYIARFYKKAFQRVCHQYAQLYVSRTNQTYRSVYRMNRECFGHSLSELSTHPEFQQTGPDDVSAVVQIATCLSEPTDYITFTKRMMRAIKDKIGHLVSWPDVPPKAADDTEPAKCVGVIAEENISFHYPSSPKNGGMMLKRAGSSLVRLTVACDAKEKFIYVNLGKREVFATKKFFAKADMFFPDGSYSVGSSRFPILKNLLTPFDGDECAVNPKRQAFNDYIAAKSVPMYRALGALDARWKFHGTDLYSYDQVPTTDVTRIGITLHNMCIDKGDTCFVKLDLGLD
ncbi:hypothetical protein INT47_002321 [Mucor saturninus]|uniref:Uncharacterized protein n=1 Tax=Mucor saturninus TaxID=64648 RepID=A0A8H7QJ51_9FUNG|nr:hypothetical protein INT47_002321 [Mucor saturninus]